MGFVFLNKLRGKSVIFRVLNILHKFFSFCHIVWYCLLGRTMFVFL
jgi:hypothetical protein